MSAATRRPLTGEQISAILAVDEPASPTSTRSKRYVRTELRSLTTIWQVRVIDDDGAVVM